MLGCTTHPASAATPLRLALRWRAGRPKRCWPRPPRGASRTRTAHLQGQAGREVSWKITAGGLGVFASAFAPIATQCIAAAPHRPALTGIGCVPQPACSQAVLYGRQAASEARAARLLRLTAAPAAAFARPTDRRHAAERGVLPGVQVGHRPGHIAVSSAVGPEGRPRGGAAANKTLPWQQLLHSRLWLGQQQEGQGHLFCVLGCATGGQLQGSKGQAGGMPRPLSRSQGTSRATAGRPAACAGFKALHPPLPHICRQAHGAGLRPGSPGMTARR